MADRGVERFVSHGFSCVIGMGGPFFQNFNGYIRVLQSHPWYELGYDDVPADCHGGLTYSGRTLPWQASSLNPAPEWWLGFDTCHSCDEIRGTDDEMQRVLSRRGAFRDMDYVHKELENLAAQAERAQNKETTPSAG